MANPSQNAYDFSFKTAHGEDFPLSQFKGKVILVVNTASKCGFTGQYEGLQKLHERYADKGLVVLGIPSNDFGKQEPGDNDEIQNFCKINYGVSFPVLQKTQVSGPQAHPFYLWARQELGFGTGPKWNFHKYLINKEGKLINYFISTTSPESDKMTKAIEKALAE